MNILVKARHMETTDAIRKYVETKAAKLPRFYDNVRLIEVVLDVEADQSVVEIVVGAAKTKNSFVAKHRDNDMYACVDQCLHKIAEQLRRHKDKVRNHRSPPHSEIMEQEDQ